MRVARSRRLVAEGYAVASVARVITSTRPSTTPAAGSAATSTATTTARTRGSTTGHPTRCAGPGRINRNYKNKRPNLSTPAGSTSGRSAPLAYGSLREPAGDTLPLHLQHRLVL